MKSNTGLIEAIVELSHERGLDQDIIIEAIEDAIVGAAYKKYKEYRNIEAVLDKKTGGVELMYFKTVAESIQDSHNQISLDEVRKFDPEAEPGDEVEFEIDATQFQGVIAQTARQLIFQKINEAERESIVEKYREKVGEIVHGQVGRIEKGRTIVMIGHTVEAALERREQIAFEKLQPGDNVRALLLEIRSEGRGPQLVLTRTHPNFLMKLMEVEVPEVFDGVIDVMGAAREPGRRAKVAVRSNDPDVDPVGACVGVRGSRIQSVVGELCGERIDVIEFVDDKMLFIANALAPAEIVEMSLDEDARIAEIKVMPDQLSLAIGKQGQNVRLASKLSGYSINISPWESHDPFEEQEAKAEAAQKESEQTEPVVAEESAEAEPVVAEESELNAPVVETAEQDEESSKDSADDQHAEQTDDENKPAQS